jgi:hypothetical protein
MPAIPPFGQKDLEVKANMGYIARPTLKDKKNLKGSRDAGM